MKPSSHRSKGLMLNLASMIDVIFLLLIYFMVSMVVAPPEDRLSSTIQTKADAESGSHTDFQPQIVDVMVMDGEPTYRIGSQTFHDADSLAEALAALNKDTGLFIKVHDEPTVGFTMGAFQAGHDAGFQKVTYVVPD